MTQTPAPSKIPERTVPAVCGCCGTDFAQKEYFVMDEWTHWGAVLCDACDDAAITQRVAETAKKTEVQEWEKRWLEIVPADFRTLDHAKLPNRTSHDRAMRWTVNEEKNSLLLVGATGQGKSRALYWKLRAVLKDNPRMKIEHFDCISFGEESRARSYRGTGKEWFDHLGRVDLVIFDDLFRGNLTEQSLEELFGLISIRTAERLPIIATTQFTGATLDQVMKPHHVDAMSRRLKEYFTVVNFGDGKTKDTP